MHDDTRKRKITPRIAKKRHECAVGSVSRKEAKNTKTRGTKLVILLIVSFAFGSVAFPQTWSPPPGHTQVRIWPRTPPDQRPNPKPETAKLGGVVAGKPWTEIDNVTIPTMTVYRPVGRNTGAAVVVFPGGGYEILAIDLEGTEVCEWLASKGITGVLLKYRVPAPRSDPYWGAYPQSPMAIEDAQRTMGLVRLHAREWQIDPHKTGVLGFSAGGHLVAAISTHFDKRLYRKVDSADDLSCRPDFAAALYPGHLHLSGLGMRLNPYVPVTKRTPPTFLLQAEDDHVDSVNDSLVYYIALKNAGVPVEMHLFPHGGHAFGMRATRFPITRWPELFEVWLRSLGMIPLGGTSALPFGPSRKATREPRRTGTLLESGNRNQNSLICVWEWRLCPPCRGVALQQGRPGPELA